MGTVLLKSEVMSAAEKLGEAFLARGFLVKVKGDRLIFSPGNTLEEMGEVRRILERAGVPALYDGWQVQILAPRIPNHVALHIMKKPGRHAHYYIPYGFHCWRGFTKRNHGLRFNAHHFDPGVALLIKAMSEAGILVSGGCDGHERENPRLYFASPWTAAWFEIIREELMLELPLHYVWNVKIPDVGSPMYYAVKPDYEQWDRKKIQHDTVQMALILRQNAERLRIERRQAFKFRSMRDTAKTLKRDYPTLRSWMEEQYRATAR